MTNDPLHQYISQNWEGFKKYATKAAAMRSDRNIHSLLEELENHDILTTPSSTRIEYYGCYQGGLVEHAVRTLLYMLKLKTVYGLEKEVSGDSLVITALFHDIGKVGNLPTKTPYYIEQNSSWHREKLGQLFEINPKMAFVSPQQLSLFNLAHGNIVLSVEEWYAISSLKQEESDYKQYPRDNEPPLSMILRHAIAASSKEMKNRTQVTDLTKIGK